jgi:ABC-2 type transport system permease protein
VDRTRDFIPSYPQYYGFISAAIVLFVVFSAPEALCPDRRFRALSLYLASPLTRDTYLLAKAAAVGTVLTLVTTGPLLLLLAGYVLQSHGPHGPLGVLIEVVRILGAGLTMAAFYTAFSLAVSSLTDRKGLATGASLLVLFGTQAVTTSMVYGFGLPKPLLLLNLNFTPYELAVRLLGGRGEALALPGTPTATVALVCLAWTVLFSLLVWVRYQQLQVTR